MGLRKKVYERKNGKLVEGISNNNNEKIRRKEESKNLAITG